MVSASIRRSRRRSAKKRAAIDDPRFEKAFKNLEKALHRLTNFIQKGSGSCYSKSRARREIQCMHDALVYGDVAGSETCVPRMLFIRKNVDTLIRGDANRIKIMRLTIALQLQEWEKEERAAAIEPVAVFDMLDA